MLCIKNITCYRWSQKYICFLVKCLFFAFGDIYIYIFHKIIRQLFVQSLIFLFNFAQHEDLFNLSIQIVTKLFIYLFFEVAKLG
jgi:hypothetical protein